ncbi:hypothetical protein F444_18962 [Phytophthora nicotianae P1976]|uniref:Uncharacterized protein n=1 Tax=Phytophthora nicotianae P1976 TaxID=1317066 RepID=A0A080Z9I3_PHYNI|nr:hypothetical protein F444_18962 [Phytophthora nicotianae P1976]
MGRGADLTKEEYWWFIGLRDGGVSLRENSRTTECSRPAARRAIKAERRSLIDDCGEPLTAERRPVLLDRDVRQLVRAAATGDYFAAELKTKFSVKASVRTVQRLLKNVDHLVSTKMDRIPLPPTNPQLCALDCYFSSVWPGSTFERWQVYHIPRGFATTNNQAKQFNRAIKREYTLRARVEMGTLIDQLHLCVRTEEVRSKPFATTYSALSEHASPCWGDGELWYHSGGTPSHETLHQLLNWRDYCTSLCGYRLHSVRSAEARIRSAGQADKKALPVTACVFAHRTQGWRLLVYLVLTGRSMLKTRNGCRIFLKTVRCIHLVYVLPPGAGSSSLVVHDLYTAAGIKNVAS